MQFSIVNCFRGLSLAKWEILNFVDVGRSTRTASLPVISRTALVMSIIFYSKVIFP